jgi:hypothetical protein
MVAGDPTAALVSGVAVVVNACGDVDVVLWPGRMCSQDTGDRHHEPLLGGAEH